ncbi:MAG TPA: nuclear transport factor 2 family protein [Vicinamibacterales bacterium]|nr:nuclear transport factor 2 family protein [Vicinamibacterales bacterium]
MPPLVFRGLAALLLLVVPGVARAQTEASDRSAIRAVALDYIEGWYTGNAERMERAVHPELAKRIVQHNPVSGAASLGQQSAMTLVQNTRAGGGTRTPVARQLKDITVLDVYENAASVKIVAAEWVDYLHLARWNGTWKIVNVLWELKAGAGQ